MKLAKGLLVGALLLTTQITMAEDRIFSIQEVTHHYIVTKYPDHMDNVAEVEGLKEKIKGTWEMQKIEPDKRAYYYQQRKQFENDLSNAEERVRRQRGQAISELKAASVQNKAYASLQEATKADELRKAAAHDQYIRSFNSYQSETYRENKPLLDANDAKLEAQKTNENLRAKSFFLFDESLKGKDGFITKVMLSSREKALVVSASKNFDLLQSSFRGFGSGTMYEYLKVLTGGEMGDIKTFEDFKKVGPRVTELYKGIEGAKSKEALLANAAELNKLLKPLTSAVEHYKAQDYKIMTGVGQDFILEKDGHRFVLNETGKVKGIFENGKTIAMPKRNLKTALAALGLSTFALAASASEAASVETMPEVSAPKANFQAKAQFQQGAR